MIIIATTILRFMVNELDLLEGEKLGRVEGRLSRWGMGGSEVRFQQVKRILAAMSSVIDSNWDSLSRWDDDIGVQPEVNRGAKSKQRRRKADRQCSNAIQLDHEYTASRWVRISVGFADMEPSYHFWLLYKVEIIGWCGWCDGWPANASTSTPRRILHLKASCPANEKR